jgi:hypothetical protein
MTTTGSASSRAREERAVRITVAVMASAIPVYAGVFFWLLGLDVRPHRIGYACIVTGACVVFGIATTWFFYYIKMKEIRDKYAKRGIGRAQG